MNTQVSNQVDMAAIKAAQEKRDRKAALRKVLSESLKAKTIPSEAAIARSAPVDMEKFAEKLAKAKEEKELLAKAKKETKQKKLENKTQQKEPTSAKINRLRDAYAIAKALQGKKVTVKPSEKKAKKHVRTPEEERIHLENLSEIRIKRREKKQQQQKAVDRAIAKLKKSGWCPPKARPSVPIDTKRYVLKQFTIQPTDDNSFERTVCREVAVTLNPQALRKYAKTEHERLLELNKNKLGYYGISIEPAENATGEKLKLIETHWRKKFAA